jgi:hypothetical protein
MRIQSRRGQNEKNEKKQILQLENTQFFLLLFLGWTFGFAFER